MRERQIVARSKAKTEKHGREDENQEERRYLTHVLVEMRSPEKQVYRYLCMYLLT